MNKKCIALMLALSSVAHFPLAQAENPLDLREVQKSVTAIPTSEWNFKQLVVLSGTNADTGFFSGSDGETCGETGLVLPIDTPEEERVKFTETVTSAKNQGLPVHIRFTIEDGICYIKNYSSRQ